MALTPYHMSFVQKWGRLIATASAPLAGLKLANGIMTHMVLTKDQPMRMTRAIIGIALKLNPACKGLKQID